MKQALQQAETTDATLLWYGGRFLEFYSSMNSFVQRECLKC